MTNCYDLTLRYIEVIADIDRLIEKKSKCNSVDERLRLDKEITRAEVEMFEIKKILKSKNVY